MWDESQSFNRATQEQIQSAIEGDDTNANYPEEDAIEFMLEEELFRTL